MTINDYNELPNDSVMASGFCRDDSTGLNMTNSNKLLKWVAFKDAHGWSIFCNFAKHNNSVNQIINVGQRVSDINNVKRVFKCDEDVLNLYYIG
jgi:hypothetical protein